MANKKFTEALLGEDHACFDLNFESKSLREGLTVTGMSKYGDGWDEPMGEEINWELNSDFSDAPLDPEYGTVITDGESYGTPEEWLKELTATEATADDPNYEEFLNEYAKQNDFTTTDEMLQTYGFEDGTGPVKIYKLEKDGRTAYAADFGEFGEVEDEVNYDYNLTELLTISLGLSEVSTDELDQKAYDMAHEGF